MLRARYPSALGSGPSALRLRFGLPNLTMPTPRGLRLRPSRRSLRSVTMPTPRGQARGPARACRQLDKPYRVPLWYAIFDCRKPIARRRRGQVWGQPHGGRRPGAAGWSRVAEYRVAEPGSTSWVDPGGAWDPREGARQHQQDMATAAGQERAGLRLPCSRVQTRPSACSVPARDARLGLLCSRVM